MPNLRFINLALEKKERIRNAVINELTNFNFNNLSINRIIKNASIPRGSFYQYFKNKDDLLEYIMSDYTQYISNYVNSYINNIHWDVFNLFIDVYDKICEFCFNSNHLILYRNVFSQLRIDEKYSFEVQQLFNKYISSVDLQQYKSQDLDVLTEIFEILMILLRTTITKTFTNLDHKNEIRNSFVKKVLIIKNHLVEVE